MVLWQQGVRFAARKMPKLITPTTHAALDYGVAGIFLVMAARLWKRNQRAALGALLCGAATTANALLTDYPGGAFDIINYKTHGKIDAGLAGLTAATPRLMGFSGDSEAGVFNVQALAETVVTSLTDFNYYENS